MNYRKSFLKRQFKSAFYSTIGRFINVSTFFVLVALSIALSWIPDGIFYFIEKYSSKDVAYTIQLVIGLLILIILFSIGAYLSKKKFPEFEIYSKSPDKKRNLIIFLSKGNIENLSQIKTFEDFKKVRNPWQMPAAAIKYHLPNLENVFVILSSESKKHYKEFEDLIKRIFSNSNLKLVPIGLDKDLDFENLNQIQIILKETYEVIEKEYKGNAKDTIIDITGGQKVVSIVGALQTIINDREFQYVSTTDYSIKSFDIKYTGEDE